MNKQARTRSTHRPMPPNTQTVKLFNQFVKDVPRVDMYLNGSPYDDNSAVLFTRLWQIFKESSSVPANKRALIRRKSVTETLFSVLKTSQESKDEDEEESRVRSPKRPKLRSVNEQVFKTVEFCTQTALAPWFVAAQKRWCTKPNVHVVDGGRQKIEICTETSVSINIEKPFKIVEINESGETEKEENVILRLKYEHDTDQLHSEWVFADKSSRKMPTRQSTQEEPLDWVFV